MTGNRIARRDDPGSPLPAPGTRRERSQPVQRRLQLFDANPNPVLVRGGVAEDEAARRQRLQAESGEGRHDDARRGSERSGAAVVDARRQPADQLHAGFGRGHVEQAAETSAQLLAQQVARWR